ncbi:MAG: hypothetical protein ACM30E_01930 [Nitrososphaerales archaeon]
MSNSLDAALIFGFLSFLNFWGGAAAGAGARGRRVLPVLWGCLIGGAPVYFGIERGVTLGEWGWLVWQCLVFAASALLIANRLPRLRALFLTDGMNTLVIGTFIMAVGAVLGAWFFRQGSEFWSLAAGGVGFLFGAMWFGAGIKQLRGK